MASISPETRSRAPRSAAQQHGVVVCDAAGDVVHLTDGTLWLLGVGRLATHRDLAASLETDPGAPSLPVLGTSGMAVARPRQGGGRLIVSSHPFSLPAPSGGSVDATAYVLVDASGAREDPAIDRGIAAVLSHELRTPITTIYAGSQMLLHRSRLTPEVQREMLVDIQIEAERLYRLVEDLLVANRGQSGIEVSDEPILLQRILPRVVSLEASRWPHVNFVMTLANDLPAVRADELYVGQVLRDLLANAGSFSGDEGSVRVDARVEHDEVEIRVLDDGPGISDDDVQSLFLPFGGVQPGGGGRPGPGLGLYVCKLLVEAMGGRIWASRRPSGGAEFGFSLLPYHDEAIEDQQATEASAG